MTVSDLVANPELLQELIDGGETLFVEHKERDPKKGLGVTVASFANMLGGWLLIGVDDKGNVVGYEPPGTVDIQDYVRDLLRSQVDPLPPFAAAMIDHPDGRVAVVRVFESTDLPHVAGDGVIYRRNPGGKEPVTEARDIIEMSRRGEEARMQAEQVRMYGLLLIAEAMATPEAIFGDEPGRADLPPLLHWTVRASPYTVTAAFSDAALSQSADEVVRGAAKSLLPHPTEPPPPNVFVTAHARGLSCVAEQMGATMHADAAIDSGGVVAARIAHRRTEDFVHLGLLAKGTLADLLKAVVTMLTALDGFGRSALSLELRGAYGLRVWQSQQLVGVLEKKRLGEDGTLYVGGDIAIPATPEDVKAVTERWAREIGRAADLPLWEPTASGEAPNRTISPS